MPCLTCGGNHLLGPCPTRARSNALTGWNDPRLPRIKPIEQNYLNQLKQPAIMAPTLRTFVQQVFLNKLIMDRSKSAADRSKLIYRMYSASGAGAGPQRHEKEFFLAVGQTATFSTAMTNVFFQNVKPKLTLKDAVKKLNAGESIPEMCFYDFLYFQGIGRGNPMVRLYLNVRVQSMPNMVNLIGSFIGKTPRHGIVDFKLTGPRAASGRADTFVVYCVDEESARALGEYLLKYPTNFENDVPGMTTRLAPGLGLAIGAEPEQQATGMAASKGPPTARNPLRGENAQSFGTIRAELVAMAIENYLENGAQVRGITEFEKFCKFVCIGFRGYGLDPQNPGS